MARKKKGTSNAEMYKKITARVIEALKGGKIAWQRPWKGGIMPMNYVSKKAYRGINIWLLAMTDFESPYWLTYKQAESLGGNVKKGERGTKITYWNVANSIVKDENGQPKKNDKGELIRRAFFFLKEFTVFNAEQCEGIEFKEPEMPKGAENIDSVDQIVSLYADAPVINHDKSGMRACYSPMLDKVTMPVMELFNSTEDYYSVLFHELAHSTGAEHRLNREGVANFDRFGSHQYSKEELVAEMSACFMMATAGLAMEPRENSKAYIQSWISKLENDPKLIFQASKEAQKACEYMQGLESAESGSEDSAEIKQAA